MIDKGYGEGFDWISAKKWLLICRGGGVLVRVYSRIRWNEKRANEAQ